MRSELRSLHHDTTCREGITGHLTTPWLVQDIAGQGAGKRVEAGIVSRPSGEARTHGMGNLGQSSTPTHAPTHTHARTHTHITEHTQDRTSHPHTCAYQGAAPPAPRHSSCTCGFWCSWNCTPVLLLQATSTSRSPVSRLLLVKLLDLPVSVPVYDSGL